MIDSETVKVLQDIVQKIVLPVAGAPVVADIVKRLVGPSADYFGERVKRCFERSNEMIENAEATPQNAAPNIIIPLIQAVALAENETIQEMFAALLTNARIPEGNVARPSFISIVSQLAPDEAVLFKAIGTLTNEYRIFEMGFNHIPQPQRAGQAVAFVRTYMTNAMTALPWLQNESDGNRSLRFQTCIWVLEGLKLITKHQVDMKNSIPLVSELGEALLRACRPPEPKAA